MEEASNQRTTPARRKQGRNNARSATQKAYASENDVTALESARHHSTIHTPNKARNGSPVLVEVHATQSANNNKTRNKTKAKAKNMPGSPDNATRQSNTPPQRAVSIKPAATAAFAGATFHASPAPSALPIPSFLSKSSTESPATTDKDVEREYSPLATGRDAQSPFRPSSVPGISESPLDFMFRAHREEQQRSVRGASHKSKDAAYESPQSQSFFGPADSMKASTAPQPLRTYPRQQAGGIDASELDGTPGRTMGPAFSTPYHERIKAARSNPGGQSGRGLDWQDNMDTGSKSDDPTDALKKYLFGNTSAPPQTTGSQGQAAAFVHPSTDASVQPKSRPTEELRNNDLKAMENDLRRILKLDMT